MPSLSLLLAASCLLATACSPESRIALGNGGTDSATPADSAAHPDTAADTGTPVDSASDSAANTTDTGEPSPPAVFTIIAVPDTQFLPLGWPDLFDETFTWIAENAEDLNLVMVLGEGDMVQDDLPEEWVVAEAAWRKLDGVVPYALAVGNHDMSGSDTTRFNETFSRSRQSALPGFGGTLDPETMDDSWHTFSAGGVDWLVLALSWTQTTEQLIWAAGVIADHPHHRVILTTHAYLQPSGSLEGQGELIWSEVLEPAAGATLAVNGHYTSPVAGHLLQVGTAGQEVAALFANYQAREMGGMGCIRLMEFDVAAGTITVRSYAPAFDSYFDDDDNEFTLTGLELGPL